MFYLFFQKYKKEFYSTSWKSITLSERIALITLGICAFIILFLAFFNSFNLFSVILGVTLFVLAIDIVWLYKHSKKFPRQSLDDNIKTFKNRRIKWLKDTLENNDINLYSIEGIDWLIECCKEKKERDNKSVYMPSFQTSILPLCMLSFGFLITKVESEKLLNFTAMFALLLLILEMVGGMFKTVILDIKLPDSNKYMCLKEDLEYIKTQYIVKEKSNQKEK